MILSAHTKQGKFQFYGRRSWVRMKLSELQADTDWDVIFRKHVKTLSRKGYGYYFAVVVPLVTEGLQKAGFDEIGDEVDGHEFIKLKFFRKIVVSHETGEVLEIVASTKKFSQEEWSDKFEQISIWAFEYLGVTIPPPNSQSALDM